MFSSLILSLNYKIFSKWTFSSKINYDLKNKLLEKEDYKIKYKKSKNYIININYQKFKKKYTYKANNKNNSNLLENECKINLSIFYNITSKLSVTTMLEYSINKKKTNNLLIGIEYNTCSWIIRFFTQNKLNNQIPKIKTQILESTFLLQIELKGLGGNSIQDKNNKLKMIYK